MGWRRSLGSSLCACAAMFAVALASQPDALPYSSTDIAAEGDIVPVQEDGPDKLIHPSVAYDTAPPTPKIPDDATADCTDGTDLLMWAATNTQNIRSHLKSRPTTCAPTNDCFLVVSVKTRVVDGFRNRQLIRATWADPHITRPLRTRVVFLACEPDPSQAADMNATFDALALEKQVYGDLLTDELGGCVDSYFKLVDKILGFFHWVTTHHATAPYVMMADDDVYVRLDRLVGMLRSEATPRTRYYAGQVPFVSTGNLTLTSRDTQEKHYLPRSVYPIPEHSPRAIGPHYFLSRDLVRFLDWNRHDLRGAGAIDDLSMGYWLRALLRVYPVHVPVFDSILSSLCRNSLYSFGDLSCRAIRQIHTNLERGDQFCHGFRWGMWVNPSRKLPDPPKIEPRSDVVYAWHLGIHPLTRTVHANITVKLPLVPLVLPVVTFIPSHDKYTHLCEIIDRVAAEIGKRLPIMLCDDLWRWFASFLKQPQPVSAALFALLRSNLPPLSGTVVAVNVWISHRVLRWRALVESLFAGVYTDIHVFVLERHSSARPDALFEPDFVVADDSELSELLPDVPADYHLVVFACGLGASSTLRRREHQRILHSGHSVILFTQDKATRDSQALSTRLYVPLASLVFSDSLMHSPMALLEPSSERNPRFSPIKPFAVPQCNSRVVSLLEIFQSQGLDCLPLEARSSNQQNKDDELVRGVSTPDTIFAFDLHVARYTQTKFVLAFEDSQHTSPGFIAGSIVAAFLAGSVPIYDGEDATVSRLFNPKAFISCGRFAWLRECGNFVMEVDRSPALYDAMRSEPPVVNETAFYEVFSWHPDVRQRLLDDGRRGTDNLDMVERLRDMINDM